MEHTEIGRNDVEVVRVERTIDLEAPTALVWRSLADTRSLADWLGLEIVEPGSGDDAPPDFGVGSHARPEGGSGGEPEGDLAVGHALRLREPDGGERHLLVTDVEPDVRLRWHWWREDGVLSAVEITLDPVGHSSVVRVVETMAVASVSAGGRRAGLEPLERLDREWDSVLAGLGARLACRLGVPATR